MTTLTQRLQAIDTADGHDALRNILRGIEKESLRVTPEGQLAPSPHPQGLGSALTHSRITTDYSEALLEFITPAISDHDTLLQQLQDIHRFTYSQLQNDERLWVASMPCALQQDSDIPVAHYGNSNSGQMKTVYRLGLGHRYGRAMQTIAGIHFNFSLPNTLWQQLGVNTQKDRTEAYFGLIRNFRRHFWLLLYLFGASPAVCKSFVKNRDHQLQPFGHDDHSLHLPYATSLRMGNLGYQSSAQESLVVCYNHLENYLQTLVQAISTDYPGYAATGIQDAEGDYQQLNTALLQIENEFYSTIRPKRTAKSGETALTALDNGGVEYIEVRCIDLDPFAPEGITKNTLAFLDIFLLHCALSDSPMAGIDEYRDIQENQKRMVTEGRKPDLTLRRSGHPQASDGEYSFAQWSQELLGEMQPIAELLDQANDTQQYSESLAIQQAKLTDSSLTPSARLLDTMKEMDITYFQLGLLLAKQAQHSLSEPLESPLQQVFTEEAKASLEDQVAMEATSNGSFEDYLANYYAQYDQIRERTQATEDLCQ
ncbi:MAG: glutamate--cysteine ligase [Cellvibrionaceae bacterium]